MNERLVTLRGEVKGRAYHRAKTDQEREANPELTDFEKQNARRKLKGATLLLRHASAVGGEETSSSEKDGDESTNSDGNREGDESVVVTDPNTEVMEKVAGKLFALKLQFRAGEFFQNNPFVLPLLVDHVLSEARAPLCQRGGSGGTAETGKVATHLIDAYCGGGLFCLAAAAHFDHCAGIEISALTAATAARIAEAVAAEAAATMPETGTVAAAAKAAAVRIAEAVPAAAAAAMSETGAATASAKAAAVEAVAAAEETGAAPSAETITMTAVAAAAEATAATIAEAATAEAAAAAKETGAPSAETVTMPAVAEEAAVAAMATIAEAVTASAQRAAGTADAEAVAMKAESAAAGAAPADALEMAE